MAEILARFLLRSGTSVLWASINPILASGEPAYETDTKMMCIGDGVSPYTSLPKFSSASTVGQAVLTAVDANAAQTAIGGSTVGKAVFAAASVSAAQDAMGAGAGGKAVFTAANAAAARTAIGAVIGTDVQAYDADLAAMAALASNGMIARTGAGTVAARTLTAGTGISISNGDGVAGNPTITNTLTVEATVLLGTLATTSGWSVALSALDLTPYKSLKVVFSGISTNSTASNLRIAGVLCSGTLGDTTYIFHGIAEIDLSTGVWTSSVTAVQATGGGNRSGVSETYAGTSGYTTATTEVVFSLDTGDFDAGSILVYGVK